MEHSNGKLVVSTYEGGWDCLRDEQGDIIFKLALNNPANAERLMACWNACDGIEDPEKTIKGLVEVLTYAVRFLDPKECDRNFVMEALKQLKE